MLIAEQAPNVVEYVTDGYRYQTMKQRINVTRRRAGSPLSSGGRRHNSEQRQHTEVVRNELILQLEGVDIQIQSVVFGYVRTETV